MPWPNCELPRPLRRGIPGVWYRPRSGLQRGQAGRPHNLRPSRHAVARACCRPTRLLENGHLVDAFTLYRASLDDLPAMVTIHDSVARSSTNEPVMLEWAPLSARKDDSMPSACAARKALCEFRLRRFRIVVGRPRSPDPMPSRGIGGRARRTNWRWRRSNSSTRCPIRRNDAPFAQHGAGRGALHRRSRRARGGHTPGANAAGARLSAGLCVLLRAGFRQNDCHVVSPAEVVPQRPRLLNLQGQSLLQLQRPEEAVAIFEQLLTRTPRDPRVRLVLGRAYFQGGYYGEAVPLLEEQLPHDSDGSFHLQLARAYTSLGQRDKAAPLLTKSQELQKADEERRAALARRVITAPK